MARGNNANDQLTYSHNSSIPDKEINEDEVYQKAITEVMSAHYSLADDKPTIIPDYVGFAKATSLKMPEPTASQNLIAPAI